jgi:glycosyltransferase involved in cell wall biosynthesis
LNEEENIVPLVSEIAACVVPFREILFIDDHSTDATCDRIRALAGTHPIRLIEQDGTSKIWWRRCLPAQQTLWSAAAM